MTKTRGEQNGVVKSSVVIVVKFPPLEQRSPLSSSPASQPPSLVSTPLFHCCILLPLFLSLSSLLASTSLLLSAFSLFSHARDFVLVEFTAQRHASCCPVCEACAISLSIRIFDLSTSFFSSPSLSISSSTLSPLPIFFLLNSLSAFDILSQSLSPLSSSQNNKRTKKKSKNAKLTPLSLSAFLSLPPSLAPPFLPPSCFPQLFRSVDVLPLSLVLFHIPMLGHRPMPVQGVNPAIQPRLHNAMSKTDTVYALSSSED